MQDNNIALVLLRPLNEAALLSPVKKRVRETSSPSRPNKPAVVISDSPTSVITISSDSEEDQEAHTVANTDNRNHHQQPASNSNNRSNKSSNKKGT